MKGKLSCNIKWLGISLLFLAGSGNIIFSQTHISGIINSYGRVTSIGTNYVVLSDAAQVSQFKVRDTVLLIQMKGVRIYAAELPQTSYGNSGFQYGQAGMHEFLTVLSVEGGAKKINFNNNIITSGFDVLGDVQIVKVRSYNYAQVDPAGLTCAIWDSAAKTGGVLAAIVGRNLTLNGNIDVSGKGFKGGNVASSQGICVITDAAKLNKYAYSASTDSSGFKGDGLTTLADPSGVNTPPYFPVYPLFAKGYGKNFNGGGGGNGMFSGGGGGSNYGGGGKGGQEMNSCSPQYAGGWGGIPIPGTPLEGGMFLGGGGGASTFKGGVPSRGGNGGGIIILISDTLKVNGNKILAKGESAGTASGNAGSGGGGGGGSIALYLQSYATNPVINDTISANGGKGGDNLGTFGEGGGGGGGYVITNGIGLPGNVKKTVAGGTMGNRPGTETGTPGTAGRNNVTDFVPKLNGFLFNSIISSDNGKQIDSICSNVVPKKISGTQPVGGSGTYIYTWLKSSSATGPWIPITGATTKDYAPTATEASTFWIRRYVFDSGTSLKDTSLAVKIVVQPAITGNNIKKDTTICNGQNPLPLLHSGTPSGGYGNHHYQWIQSTGGAYSIATGSSSKLPDYDPPALNVPTYYKRKLTAGHCVDTSNMVTITVLPSITGNTITSPDQVICEGSAFNVLNANTPSGGTGVFVWQWQDSADLSTGDWKPAGGVNTAATHLPDTSKFTLAEEKRHFRRIAYSNDTYHVCKSASAPVLLTRYHKIKNNIIAADNTICSGFAPAGLTGNTPSQGKTGDYNYIWQQSNDGLTWPSNASGTYTLINYSPPVLTSTTWYRRIVNSGVVCTNTSNNIKITVHPSIANNTISLKSGLTDSTICSGAIPKKLLGKVPPVLSGGDGSVYTYKWRFSTDNTTWSNAPGGTTSDYQQVSALTSTTWYKRVVASGKCRDSVNSVKINVLPPVVNAIPAAKDVCINTGSQSITGLTLSGGRTNQYKFLWESSPDGTTWTNLTPDTLRTMAGANLDLPLLSSPVKYRRKVWSGPYNTCFTPSNITDVTIIQKPYPVDAGRDTILNSFEYLFKLQASEPVLGQGTWSVKSSPNTLEFDNPSIYNTTVRNLAGFDPNVLLWTVVNGVCKLESTITIEVMNIEIPGGISPNADGKNDMMIIKGLDFSMDGTGGKPSQSIDLKIINSAGTEVFHTTNDNGGQWKYWDGKDNGGIDLPEGTYYYLLKIQSNRTDKKLPPTTGFIILKRH